MSQYNEQRLRALGGTNLLVGLRERVCSAIETVRGHGMCAEAELAELGISRSGVNVEGEVEDLFGEDKERARTYGGSRGKL